MSEKRKRKTSIPNSLQPILWSVDVKDLDLTKHKSYIIHQVLAYGTFAQIRWLFAAYTKRQIVKVFLNRPIRMYPRAVFLFVKNFILKLSNISVPEERYVTSISGPLRQRTAK